MAGNGNGNGTDPFDSPTEWNFALKRPIRYSNGGDHVEAAFVKLTAPTSKHSRECAILKQAFYRAVREARDDMDAEQREAAVAAAAARKFTEDDDDETTGEEIIQSLASARCVDLAEVLDSARRLFVGGGVALLDGEKKFTSHLLDLMDQTDFENMVGEYMARFTLASSLRRTAGPS